VFPSQAPALCERSYASPKGYALFAYPLASLLAREPASAERSEVQKGRRILPILFPRLAGGERSELEAELQRGSKGSAYFAEPSF